MMDKNNIEKWFCSLTKKEQFRIYGLSKGKRVRTEEELIKAIDELLKCQNILSCNFDKFACWRCTTKRKLKQKLGLK
jgi:hypothetical protein